MTRVKEFLQRMVMLVVTGSLYPGIFIGDRGTETTWLDEKVQVCTELARKLSGVDCKHPQSSYSRLQKSLQQEWAFVKKSTPNIGDAFGPIKKALRESLMPDLFKGIGEGITGRGDTCLPMMRGLL